MKRSDNPFAHPDNVNPNCIAGLFLPVQLLFQGDPHPTHEE
jgi:hypothetical protein